MFHSALIALKPGTQNQSFMEFATTLATRQQWKLHGISIVDPGRLVPPETVPLGGDAFKTHRDAVLLGATRAARDKELSEFGQHCQSAHLTATTLPMEGDLPTLLARAATEADVLFLGHSLPAQGSGPNRVMPFPEIFLSLPRPAIVVPRCCRDDRDPRRVVLAYDGSVQAARTLQALALSGLAADCQVRVVTLGSSADEATAMRAIRFLQSHQIDAVLHYAPQTFVSSAEILAACANFHASLLVMGAYGRSPLREFLFGSVTQGVLDQADLPIFISH